MGREGSKCITILPSRLHVCGPAAAAVVTRSSTSVHSPTTKLVVPASFPQVSTPKTSQVSGKKCHFSKEWVKFPAKISKPRRKSPSFLFENGPGFQKKLLETLTQGKVRSAQSLRSSSAAAAPRAKLRSPQDSTRRSAETLACLEPVTAERLCRPRYLPPAVRPEL